MMKLFNKLRRKKLPEQALEKCEDLNIDQIQLVADQATLIALAHRLEKIFCGKKTGNGENEGADLVDVKKRLKSLRTKAKIKYNDDGKTSPVTYMNIRDDLYKRYVKSEDYKYLEQLFNPITILMNIGDRLTTEILNKQLKLIKCMCNIIGSGVNSKCILLKNETIKTEFKNLAKALPNKIEKKSDDSEKRRKEKRNKVWDFFRILEKFVSSAEEKQYSDLEPYGEKVQTENSHCRWVVDKLCNNYLEAIFSCKITSPKRQFKPFIDSYNAIVNAVSVLGEEGENLIKKLTKEGGLSSLEQSDKIDKSDELCKLISEQITKISDNFSKCISVIQKISQQDKEKFENSIKDHDKFTKETSEQISKRVSDCLTKTEKILVYLEEVCNRTKNSV